MKTDLHNRAKTLSDEKYSLPVMSLPCLGFSAVLDFFSGVLITVEASLSNIDVS
jgi:hypothetical protein